MDTFDNSSILNSISDELDGTILSHDEMRSFEANNADLMYKPMESIFGAVGMDMHNAGWSIFPQELSGLRKPGRVDNDTIRWAETYDLANKKPPLEDFKRWLEQCSSLNVAVVLGPASGNALVIDVDVVEPDLSSAIQEIAIKHFGQTPLRRVGNWPKIALVYRQDASDPVSGRSPKFVPTEHAQNPDKIDQGLEIISTGQAMTFFGKHHKTGRYFTWLQDVPNTTGPEKCPIITSAQVADFLDEVDGIRPFHKSKAYDVTGISWEWDESQQIHLPKLRPSGAALSWTENSAGIIVDGREAYLRDITYRLVRANPGIVIHSETKSIIAAGVATLTAVAVQRFVSTAEVSGKWTLRTLEREAADRIRRVAQAIMTGRIQPNIPKVDASNRHIQTSRSYLPAQPRNPDGDSLDFLPPFVDTSKASFDPGRVHQRRPLPIRVVDQDADAIETNRADREISESRTEIADAVSTGLTAAFTEFWDDVYAPKTKDARVHILKAPTGAGKTSRGMAFIANDPRTKEDFAITNEAGAQEANGKNPILVLMPTYTNIEELKQKADIYNLDPSLSDAEFKAAAKAAGLTHEDDMSSNLAEMRQNATNAGIKTMLFQGKIRAGCLMKEKVELAMSAGIGTSSLCHTPEVKDKEGNVIEPEKFCPFYFEHHYDDSVDKMVGCPAILQRDEIQKCDVVFMPHAFLALNIPEELTQVRAVVADERIHHLFLHTATFDKNVFLSPRKPPRLTKKEREAGIDPKEFHTDRMAAVQMVNFALERGLDPAAHLLKQNPGFISETGEPIVLSWVKSAIRTCGASMEKDAKIDPEITIDKLLEICAQPTGKSVREEWRLWKIIEERLTTLHQERVFNELRQEAGLEPIASKAKGKHDHRIQVLEDVSPLGEVTQSIRISWRTVPNWVDRPLLLLDASAAPEMISKIWEGKEVVVHDIPAELNVRIVGVIDRTYSNASVVAKPSATPKEKVDSGRLLSHVRKSLSTISGLYGWSRVVAGGSILARRAVNTYWSAPSNIDWCHFGAMRGLDFAKHHAAAISVGRMELPTRTVDGLVAALTYDDDQPEAPFDLHGTGLNAQGQPLMVPAGIQTVKMRSGHDVEMLVPKYPGRWSRMIQSQYREEELLQFLGRLRPVYREGIAPIWFSLSSVIPEGVIVDDLITVDDLLKHGDYETSTYDALRRCNGILDPELAAACCPELFQTAKAAVRQMRISGFDPGSGKMKSRQSWGLVSYKWQSSEGDEGYSFIRADIKDPESALRNAFEEALSISLTKVEKTSDSMIANGAKGRKLDKIEAELGTLYERQKAELLHVETTADRILTTMTDAQSDQMLRTPSSGAKKPKAMDFQAEQSRLAIESLWRQMGYTEEAIAGMLKQSGMIDQKSDDKNEDWGTPQDDLIPY